MPSAENDPVIQNALAALHSVNPYERFAAIETLARRQHVAALGHIIDATHDPHLSVREAAVWALGDLQAAQAISTLRLLAESKNQPESIRLAAVYGLGMLADPSTLPLLLRLANLPNQTALCAGAARALIRYGEVAVTRLAVVLLDREHEGFRERLVAAQLLGVLRHPAAIVALQAAVEQDVRQVRWAAVQSLGEIASPSTLPFLMDVLENAPELGRITVWALENTGTAEAQQVAQRWRKAHHYPRHDTPHLPPPAPS
jgi:HEAT repeat protein